MAAAASTSASVAATRAWLRVQQALRQRLCGCLHAAPAVPPPHPRLLLQDEESLALIQQAFTDEMMTTIFGRLGPYALGRAACVCRQWRFLARVGVLAPGRAWRMGAGGRNRRRFLRAAASRRAALEALRQPNASGAVQLYACLHLCVPPGDWWCCLPDQQSPLPMHSAPLRTPSCGRLLRGRRCHRRRTGTSRPPSFTGLSPRSTGVWLAV